MKANVIRANVISLHPYETTGYRPHGEPPEGALKDSEGKFIVDKFGKYIVTTETV